MYIIILYRICKNIIIVVNVYCINSFWIKEKEVSREMNKVNN